MFENMDRLGVHTNSKKFNFAEFVSMSGESLCI